MSTRVRLTFNPDKQGILSANQGSSQIGDQPGALAPYDLILGGLGGCLNHTLQTILDKKRISAEHISYSIEGIKRDAQPATLRDVYIETTIVNPDAGRDALEKAFDAATRYCSVYQTLAKVASMHPKLIVK